jgi:hypothetical protein
MLLDRTETMPFGLHLQTFFPLLAENPLSGWQRVG